VLCGSTAKEGRWNLPLESLDASPPVLCELGKFNARAGPVALLVHDVMNERDRLGHARANTHNSPPEIDVFHTGRAQEVLVEAAELEDEAPVDSGGARGRLDAARQQADECGVSRSHGSPVENLSTFGDMDRRSEAGTRVRDRADRLPESFQVTVEPDIVGVEERGPIGTSRAKACIPRSARAPLRTIEHSHPRFGQSFHDRAGVAIVDDDYLDWFAALAKHAAYRRGQSLTRLPCWDDRGDGRWHAALVLGRRRREKPLVQL
jgi:hypothetical protein